jgi:hypothetical protein
MRKLFVAIMILAAVAGATTRMVMGEGFTNYT